MESVATPGNKSATPRKRGMWACQSLTASTLLPPSSLRLPQIPKAQAKGRSILSLGHSTLNSPPPPSLLTLSLNSPPPPTSIATSEPLAMGQEPSLQDQLPTPTLTPSLHPRLPSAPQLEARLWPRPLYKLS
ncbi:hypothetical protein GBAR_LOCUS9947 [Geodia barretti]|uniref:Uncharacterized protein n=1 Tax=Geodia barretti TaxID=519541 RepID=A0AA35RR40_GEOBA|nr:hypothetical protein GBAR_LOCUS9947 [Geodia barretti]